MFVYSLPIIASFIGYLTNWLAVKMLFHPRKPIHLGFFKIQGVFPKRQKVLAENLGRVVSEELVNFKDIKERFDIGNLQAIVDEALSEKIDRFLRERLPEMMPMLKMFLSDDLLAKVKALIMEELNGAIEPLVNKLMDQFGEKVDIKEIVSEKVAAFESGDLENLLNQVMKKEFKTIELVGGVLGFLIGCVQVLLIKLPEWI